MNKVAIVGTGQTKFSKHDGDVEKLLFESASDCIQSVSYTHLTLPTKA